MKGGSPFHEKIVQRLRSQPRAGADSKYGKGVFHIRRKAGSAEGLSDKDCDFAGLLYGESSERYCSENPALACDGVGADPDLCGAVELLRPGFVDRDSFECCRFCRVGNQ